MADQAESGATDVSEENEPETKGTEQATTESKSFGVDLLQVAAEMGHEVGETPPPKAEPEPEEEPSETEEPEAEEEVKPAAKKGELWPDSARARVAEETARKNRATERAEKAEALAAQLQAQLQQVVAPQPTEDDPFKDITDFNKLDDLGKSYEKAIQLAELTLANQNTEGAFGVQVGRNPDGSPKVRDFSREELAEMKVKAEIAVRRQIPERKTYLQQRAVADAEAAALYPEFTDTNSEFTQAAAVLAQSIITGQAAKDPTLMKWIGHAVRGCQMSKEKSGNGAVKSPEAKKIVQAARQKIAPTATRTRSFVERGSGSGNLDKSRERLKQEGSAEAAEELVAKLLSGGGSSKRVEPVGE